MFEKTYGEVLGCLVDILVAARSLRETFSRTQDINENIIQVIREKNLKICKITGYKPGDANSDDVSANSNFAEFINHFCSLVADVIGDISRLSVTNHTFLSNKEEIENSYRTKLLSVIEKKFDLFVGEVKR